MKPQQQTKQPNTITSQSHREQRPVSLVQYDDNGEVYSILKSLPSAPKNVIIPLCLSQVLYNESNAEINILDFPDQIYGKAVHGSEVHLTFNNGNIYEGDVLNGMLHGNGKLQFSDGVIYTGEFLFNKLTGHGLYEWPDGSTYRGQVLDSLRSGFGTFNQNQGAVIYEGQWLKGFRHGKGILKHKSGTCYTGDFENGKKKGKGKIVYDNDNYYEGDWDKDQKNGFGTMFWKTTGEKYVGEWKDNLQHGFGTHLWLEERGEGKFLRNRYEGFWVKGLREGYGVFYYANGSKYEGEWKGGLKHGFARFIEDSGEIKYYWFVEDKNPLKQGLSIENVAMNAIMNNSSVLNILNNNSVNVGGINAITESNENDEKKEVTVADNKSVMIDIIEPGADSVSRIDRNNDVDSQSPTKNLENGGDSPTTKLAKNRKKKEKIQDNSKNKPKAVVEINPFYKLIDISDIMKGINDGIAVSVMKNVTNMLLRHNPALKKYYKYYAGIKMPYEEGNSDNEIHFSLTFHKFWKLIRDIRILNPKISLSAVNRIALKGNKGNFGLKVDGEELKKKIESLKNNENMRKMTDEEILISNFCNDIMVEPVTSPILPLSRLHDSSRILLFRNFVEAITRLAWLKTEDISEFHRNLEKIIIGKLQPIFELKKKKTKESSQLGIVSHNYLGLFEEFKTDALEIFQAGIAKRQSGIFGCKDETILVKTMHNFLKCAGLIQNDEDKFNFLQLVEKNSDPDEALSSLLNETLNNTTSDKISKRKEKESQALKNKRMSHLVENELIFEEFEDILRHFLIKKKDHSIKTEAEIQKFLKKSMDEIVKIAKRDGKNIERTWPESEKDRKLMKLLYEKEEKRKEIERKRKIEAEKKKEEWERSLMALEDNNVIGSKELEELAGSELNGSQQGGNESEGSCF